VTITIYATDAHGMSTGEVADRFDVPFAPVAIEMCATSSTAISPDMVFVAADGRRLHATDIPGHETDLA
jgi:hypothetical protein